MRNDNSKEAKQLFSSNKKNYSNKGLINNKQPEFFSYFFHVLMKIYNYVLYIYILMSLTTFLMYQVFEKNTQNKVIKSGKNLASNFNSNQFEKIESLQKPTQPINMNNNTNSSMILDFSIKNTTDANNAYDANNNQINSILDNTQFLSISYTSIYFCILIVLNIISTSNKSFSIFALFYILCCVITINFFTDFFTFISFLNNINKVFSDSKNIVAKTFFIFQYIFTTLNFTMFAYFIVLYANTIGYFKYNIQDLPFESIYHEIALRTDMMKISFNYFIISIKLNKILPGLLYTKKDYYFVNAKMQKETEDYSEELYDKVDSLETKGNNLSNINKKNNSNYSSDNIHSKSTIDCEYESLK